MPRSLRSAVVCLVAAFALVGCGGSDAPQTTFRVHVQNVTPFQFLKSGTFDTPVGASGPGALGPGDAYTFTVTAGVGQRLSFATMLGLSNDWFFGARAGGIALFDDAGNLRSGDVTDEVTLWNAGTEVDQEPGVGPDTGPMQAAPDQGAADDDPSVREVGNPAVLSDGSSFDLPPVASMIKVTLTPTGNAREVEVRIENVDDGSTFDTSGGFQTVHLSPGVFAIHGAGGGLFAAGEADGAHGLEQIAESGNPAMLSAYVQPLTGVITGFSPVLWAVSSQGEPFFTSGAPDRGAGLEHLAEDGDGSGLLASLDGQLTDGLERVALQAIPDGATDAGPLLPGSGYTFEVTGAPGDHLSLASMFGASNDWVAATDPEGIALFDAAGMPLSGDVSSELSLWDVGTEQSEEPGVGPDTGPQQAAPNTGAEDSDRSVRKVGSAYATPLPTHLMVTVTPITQ